TPRATLQATNAARAAASGSGGVDSGEEAWPAASDEQAENTQARMARTASGEILMVSRFVPAMAAYPRYQRRIHDMRPGTRGTSTSSHKLDMPREMFALERPGADQAGSTSLCW